MVRHSAATLLDVQRRPVSCVASTRSSSWINFCGRIQQFQIRLQSLESSLTKKVRARGFILGLQFLADRTRLAALGRGCGLLVITAAQKHGPGRASPVHLLDGYRSGHGELQQTIQLYSGRNLITEA